MDSQETLYAIALTRMRGVGSTTALHLTDALGSATAVYEHRRDVAAAMPGCTARLAEALKDWDEALSRAAAELDFTARHGLKVFTRAADGYPQRLRHCPDAPLVLYYKGTAGLNQARVINIVGTRHCTPYGQELVDSFISRLKVLCPQVLIVSGLAYGIDICAHRGALAAGFETVGVLAHGLDTIYPAHHRSTAADMTRQGGLLTEYTTGTEPLPNNFRQRNRIVAGMSDATIVVESAAKGGALITARIAQDYGRDVFAFPGNVGAACSEGCNRLIRDNRAALITSADDFVQAMGWPTEQQRQQNGRDGVERQLFPELTAEEQAVVSELAKANDLQLNTLAVRTNQPINGLTAVLFSLEMKGVVRPLAGGTYHLLALG